MNLPNPNTLSELFSRNFKVLSGNIHTALPGKVVQYDGSRSVDVQPLIQKKLADGTFIELPVIVDVPLIFPGSSTGVFTFPIKRNDGVLLVFSERSIEEWMGTGANSQPGDLRRFSLTDAIAIPGLFYRDAAIPENRIGITEDGHLALKNATTDLLTVLEGLIDEIIAIKTTGSPSNHVLDPSSVTALTNYKTTVQGLLSDGT